MFIYYFILKIILRYPQICFCGPSLEIWKFEKALDKLLEICYTEIVEPKSQVLKGLDKVQKKCYTKIVEPKSSLKPKTRRKNEISYYNKIRKYNI